MIAEDVTPRCSSSYVTESVTAKKTAPPKSPCSRARKNNTYLAQLQDKYKSRNGDRGLHKSK